MNALSALFLLAQPADEPIRDVLPQIVAIDWAEVASYVGLAGVVTALVEILKRAIRSGWWDGKEQFIAFVLAPALGFGSHFLMGWYSDVPWYANAILFLIVGASGAGYLHDSMLNPIIGILKGILMRPRPGAPAAAPEGPITPP